MKIELNLDELREKNIRLKEYVFLYLYYYKRLDLIRFHFKKEEAYEIIRSLIELEYILNQKDNFTFSELILSNNKVTRLFGIKGDVINFLEFYNCYPVRVGNRVLRGKSGSQVATKHEKKYLARVKTKAQHELAIKAITTFVSKKKQANELSYLPAMETVMNNSLWETWETFIEDVGTEGLTWNSDVI